MSSTPVFDAEMRRLEAEDAVVNAEMMEVLREDVERGRRKVARMHAAFQSASVQQEALEA